MKLRQSPLAKGICVLVLLGSLCFTALCGYQGLWQLDFAYSDNWQDSGIFVNMQRKYYYDVGNLYSAERQLELGNLDYVEEMDCKATVENLEKKLAPENTNYRYQILSDDGKTVIKSNLKEGETLQDVVLNISYDKYQNDQIITMDIASDTAVSAPALELEPVSTSYIIASGVAVNPQVDDVFFAVHQWYENSQSFASVIMGMVWGGVLSLLCLLFLLWSAGYRPGDNQPSLGWWDRLPLELHLLSEGIGVGCAIWGCMTIFQETWINYWYSWGYSLPADEIFAMGSFSAAALSAVGGLVGVMALCTLTARLRCKMLLKSTLCYYMFNGLFRKVVFLVDNLSILWRVAVLFFIYVCFNYMARYGLKFLYPIPVFLVDGLALGALLWWTYSFRRVRDGADAISTGNLSHRIDTDKLPHDLRVHAESINNISLGMESAVDSRIKSERFKAELITNVSHDLKTPLTSIINYVDLLKSTEQVDPHAAEYIEVLDRKSQRLKKLTEDLVEASKASTGTLKVNREKIRVEQLLDQAIGEYQEKLDSKGLLLVTAIAEGESFVMADGRHLWRVIDNLLGNCAKYAMEGTRVYIELTRGHGQVELSVKNISREPLTTTADQLVERFVRGEESRTTEGSGLGLSIAKNLTELQGGTFQLVLDGDLFKAIVTMPQAG